MSRRISEKIVEWLKDRTNIGHIPFFKVPYTYFNLDLWLGAIVAASFFWLALTGLLLILYYRPEAPLESTKQTLFERPFGGVLLTSHLYAAHFMILATVVHAFRNLFKGVYKRPRELVWILGVATGFMALQTAFFGYSLVGDRIAKEAINIGSALTIRSLGEALGIYLVSAVFSLDPGETYYRVFAMHIIFATILFLLFMAHFGLFELHGPAPREEETNWKVDPPKIDQNRKDLAPWFPVNLVFILSVTFSVWGLILIVDSLAMRFADLLPPLFKPYPVEAEDFTPMPPWFFLFAYRIFQFTFLTLPHPQVPQLLQFIVAMILPPLILIALPFIDRNDSRHPLDRPVPVILGALMFIYFFQLTIWALIEPGIPIKFLQALVVMVPPFLAVTVGYRILRRIKLGHEVTPKEMLAGAAIISGGTILIIAAAMATGITGLAEEIIIGVFGLAMAITFIGWLASKLTPEEAPKVVENKNPDESLPSYLLGIAVLELLIGLFAFFSLIAIAIIDPVGYMIQAAGMLGLLFFSAAGLAYSVFRALIAEKLPPADLFTEIKPHLPVFIAFLIVVIVVL